MSDTQWWTIDGADTTWVDADSLSAGVGLAHPILAREGWRAVDVRATGVRIRMVAGTDAPELDLDGGPRSLDELAVIVESPDPAALLPFWQRALDRTPWDGTDRADAPGDGAETRLTDPLVRDPDLVLRASTDHRPLRNRIHIDVVRPASRIARAALGEPGDPFGVRHSDADGNEVDLVPGGPLGSTPATEDWHAVFGAVACYRTDDVEQQLDLAAAAAHIADDAEFPLLVDLRPGLVVLDTGKDMWDADAHGRDLDVADLAARIQRAARELGATPDPALPRFVQVFLDAADVEAARRFWCAALGYFADRRPDVTDIVDPRRLGPPLVFQQVDTSESDRLAQRNRLHLELAVPDAVAPTRVAAATAAGGRLLEEDACRWRLADASGNELVVLGV